MQYNLHNVFHAGGIQMPKDPAAGVTMGFAFVEYSTPAVSYWFQPDYSHSTACLVTAKPFMIRRFC